eukprot:TRINITY_DN6043_c0_g1_i1.p1 TRINITY_DN6043_c0_g1~~TRINITY_DN6043_c0_g1_i1.p1  ORF type:complete len:331 (-),score=83.20 TRINITY_DN6043_c0_g1_i1:98-1090(-)
MYLRLLKMYFFFFQAEDGIRDAQESRGLGDVYKRQVPEFLHHLTKSVNLRFSCKQDNGALQLEGGCLRRVLKEAPHSVLLHKAAEVSGAPADALRLYWCDSWKRRNLIKPTNLRGPIRLESILMYMPKLGSDFRLEYEVMPEQLQVANLVRVAMRCTGVGNDLNKAIPLSLYLPTNATVETLAPVLSRLLSPRGEARLAQAFTTTPHSLHQLSHDQLLEVSADAQFWVQLQVPHLHIDPKQLTLAVQQYYLQAEAVRLFRHPLVLNISQGETVLEVKQRLKVGLFASEVQFGSWGLALLTPTCLLYTSDAADEEDSVDLGGRRIIQKKIR